MKTSKTILITGAASGIGLATVRLFYANGWKVIAADINQAALKVLQTELGDEIVAIQADISTRNGASALMAAASSATQGKLDCLFNCAGLLQMGPHSSIDPLLIDRMMDVNIKGVLYRRRIAFAQKHPRRAYCQHEFYLSRIWLARSCGL